MPSLDTQFKKGHTKSGGRKRGARNKLTNAWIKNLYEIYQDGGKEKLRQAMAVHIPRIPVTDST